MQRCPSHRGPGARYAPLAAAVPLALTSISAGQANLLPLDPGEIVVTCHSGYPLPNNGFVVGVMDARDPGANGATKDVNWVPSMYHGEAIPGGEWNVGNLGQVFGVCIDDQAAPNIYVTASTIYGEFINPGTGTNETFGPGGAGAVYRIDGTTGVITTFATLNNGRPGLGNIAFDERHDQFYVSNFEDGEIVILDMAGTQIGTYDHGLTVGGVLDDPTVDWTPFGRRVWAVENHRGRLYYSLWNEDIGCDPLLTSAAMYAASRNCPNVANVANEIWSVAIDATTGMPTGAPVLEITLPAVDPTNTGTWQERTSNPVSDIAFTSSGKLLAAERSRLNDWGRGQWPNHPGSPWDAHTARVLEATGGTGAWTLAPVNTYRIGWNLGGASNQACRNSAGGVAPDCDENVWCTGDMIHFGFSSSVGRYVYGLQRIEPPGNATTTPYSTSNSYIIDADANTNAGGKTQIGDVEIYEPGCECMEVTIESVDCSLDPIGALDLSMTITNNSGLDAGSVFYFPTTPGVSIAPTSTNFSPTLADGDSVTINSVTVTLPAGVELDKVSFYVVLLTPDGEECCAVETCIEVPDCDCLLVSDCEIICDPDDPSKYIVTVTVTNVSPGPIHRFVYLFPNGESALPGVEDLNASPLPVGGSHTLTTTICDATPGSQLCMIISAHDEQFIECCAIEKKFDVPYCDTMEPKPDRCIVTRIANCCPQQPDATISLTMCNCGDEERVYDWVINPLPASPTCPVMLDPSDFSAISGTIGPVPPGECMTVTVTVRCERLAGTGLPSVCSGFNVSFNNVVTGEKFECDGIVQYRDDWTIKQVDEPIDVPIGAIRPVRFEVTNVSDPTGLLPYQFLDNNPLGDIDWGYFTLNDGDALVPTIGMIEGLGIGATATISVDIQFGDQTPADHVDAVYVQADPDRDGAMNNMAAATVHATSSGATGGCIADVNGDGSVTVLDLLDYLAFWFAGDLGADLTADGLVNVLDLLTFLDDWFDACAP